MNTPIKDSAAEVQDVMRTLFGSARAEAVFSQPVTAAGRTVITAAEVAAGGGFGSGMGFGPRRRSVAPPKSPAAPAGAAGDSGAGPTPAHPGGGSSPDEESGSDAPLVFADQVGGGSGGGGGGGAISRPVAAIVISDEGVTVQPIFDITKILLAFLAASAAMVGLGLSR